MKPFPKVKLLNRGTPLSMNRPTPSPSQEGSGTAGARLQFPSWEGLGVGSGEQIAAFGGPWNLSPSDGEREEIRSRKRT